MIRILPKTLLAFILIMFLATGQAAATKFAVTVKNITNGLYFTPLLITAHNKDTQLFETGAPASASLQAMAEGGDISGLTTMVGGEDLDTKLNPADGLLEPGGIVSDIYFNTNKSRNRYLSLVAMLLPTNDGFVGIDSLRIPNVPGTYKYYLLGYDAGTEANDELITGGGMPGEPGIPAAPGMDAGTGGSGVSIEDTNQTVHIHRGNVGDAEPAEGISDLDSGVHRWLNPVAELIIEVLPYRKWRYR